MSPHPDPILAGDLAPRAKLALQAILHALIASFSLMVVAASLYLKWSLAASLAGFLLAALLLRYMLGRAPLAAVCYGLIAAMLGLGVAATIAYGSIRGGGSLAFIVAIIIAGIFAERWALGATVAASSVSIGVLAWAERAGWMAPDSYAVGPAQWFVHTLVLAVIAMSLYLARGTAVGTVRRLRASEESMATFFQASPAALIVSTRRDGRILDINQSYERIFATSRGQAVGRTVLELGLWARAEDRARFLAAMERDGQVSNFNADLVRANGEPFKARLSAKVIDGEDEPLLLGLVSDLSAEEAAEETVRRSEQRFRQIFEFSPIGMAISRVSDGVFVDANHADGKTLGYKREELVGRTSLEIGTWASLEDRKRFVDRLRANREIDGYETRMRNKAGEPVDCRVWARLVDLGGEECVLAAIINVTEQNRAAEREHQLRSKFEALFETSPEGIAVMRLRDGVLLEANDAACAQFGIAREAAVGRSVMELGMGATQEDNAEIFAQLRAEGRVVNRPTRFRSFRGEWMDFLLSAVVLKLDGQTCVVWSWRNVTAQRRTEQTLRESEERFRGLTDFFASFMWELDDQLRFTMVRGRGLDDLGLKEEDLVGLTILDVGGAGRILPMNTTWEAFAALRARREAYRDVRISFRLANGELKYLSLWGEPVFGADGTFRGYRGITQDITERVRLELQIQHLNETLERRVEERTAELENANKELESFSYSVSHDLRAPLRAIAGFSAVIREEFGPGLPQPAQRYFHRIEQNAEQMRRLIDDLLGLARAGRMSLSRAPVDMRSLAEDVVRELSHQAPHAAQVTVGPLPGAVGDAVLLRQVWSNL
ncbi:MAG: PAS domain S-box protein, partial [Proteobacteria bacterium]|nr:PAS domain S-box protein [Pseudomonadota bacterium]